ncbi:hypothetical protein [Microbacterium sp. 77mftsu3.1]|uniref:hypothetical protein n=1 Tax=Microbacterium sp. 77mftsu3.1 TaxID=1761802 RepID=UPI000361F8C2|nr:hypothetical protein [Microbacterium sp. 77mftsu3.1]
MTDINAAAEAARENHRESATGRFGVQTHTAPEATLAPSGPPTLLEARQIMSELRPGASALVTLDGQEYAVIVQREAEGPGHPDYKSTTVGYGPGRWNLEVNAAGIAAGTYAVKAETNAERLHREALITDPGHRDYNSDMDIIVAGTTKTYRDLALDGVYSNDNGEVDAWVERQAEAAAPAVKSIDDQSPTELVATLRATTIQGTTVLFEETDQGGRWLNPIGLRFEDGTRVGAADAEDLGVDWETIECAASNIRGSEHPDFVETDSYGGFWELPPATR